MPKKPVKRHHVTQPSDPTIRLIPLTQGRNAIVDIADYEWLSQWNWSSDWNHDTKSFYARNRKGRMHRVILGCKSGEMVDHINSNTLDNRRNNLRKCTSTENTYNQRKRSDNTSGFKGVYPQQEKWIAQIGFEGTQIYLGIFASPKKAAEAYDVAARRLHGEFARVNFPH